MQQIILIEPRSGISRWIDKVGTKLAAFSYTLYLSHILVLDVLRHYGAERPEMFSVEGLQLYLLWTLVALIVCYGIYWCTERHTYAVKRWFKSVV